MIFFLIHLPLLRVLNDYFRNWLQFFKAFTASLDHNFITFNISVGKVISYINNLKNLIIHLHDSNLHRKAVFIYLYKEMFIFIYLCDLI